MRYVMALLTACLFINAAQAEIVRGGMDCKITDQLYQKIDENGLSVREALPRGDKIGATLRLRYEFDRATPSLPWRLKTEFGRMAILFDAKFPPKTLAPMQEEGKVIGFKALSKSTEVAAFFTSKKIRLITNDSKTIFIHKGDGNWSGLHTEHRSKSGEPPSSFGLLIGFDCHHKIDEISRLTSLLP